MNLGVCYYPEHWEKNLWKEDAMRMADLGIRYVRLAEFSWSKLEPREGRFEFDWLDGAVDTLGAQGLRLVMCTPTATPPKWLVERHPSILAVDENGRTRKFGSRRHYSFNSKIYREYSDAICETLAKRYGKNPHVAGWQTDNEFGCHNTTRCYSEESRRSFVQWLESKYGEVGNLNRAWGNVFWSMEYGDFAGVELPNLTATEANPAHRMDFARFSSEQVARFNRSQTRIIRKHSPGRWITHNSMGLFFDYDHHQASEDLDFWSWDSYPLGFLADFDLFDPERKKKFLRKGHPDLNSFMHDIYRGKGGQGKFWVMEQQPGPVNWARYNPAPEKGMVRLWTWQAFAHGAETVSYFRWRQCPFAQEQMHSGLNFAENGYTDYVDEIKQTRTEIQTVLPHHQPKNQANAALVLDYESIWALQIQPQGENFDPIKLHMNFYQALKKLGYGVDIVSKNEELDGYSILTVPGFVFENRELFEKIKNFQGLVLMGPRTFSKTRDFRVANAGGDLFLEKLLGTKIKRVESLPRFHREKVLLAERKKEFEFTRWKELAEKADKAPLLFEDGSPAAVENGNAVYFGFFPCAETIAEYLLSRTGVNPPLRKLLPEGVSVNRLGNLKFWFNFTEEDFAIPFAENEKIILGDACLKPGGLCILKSE